MSEWISVEKDMPTVDDVVFVCQMGAINEYSYPYTYEDTVEVAFCSAAGRWFLEDWDEDRFGKDDFLLEGVTHWMPLPPEPNGE